jgi:thiol-disulfide isomerase/thioredoxin
MKSALFCLLAASIPLLSCKQKSTESNLDKTSNMEIVYGYATVHDLKQPPYASWFTVNYESYEPNHVIIDSISLLQSDLSITIVLGTWCGDSKREVPRFIKILELINFPQENLKLIGVDKKKACPEAGINQGEVAFVPTFYFFRNGVEIGQIVEKPVSSLELEFLEIVK